MPVTNTSLTTSPLFQCSKPHLSSFLPTSKIYFVQLDMKVSAGDAHKLHVAFQSQPIILPSEQC